MSTSASGRRAGGQPVRAGASVSYLLINPPVTDPTAPYHSIPYLVGAARAAGYREYRCVDANLDAFEYLARPAHFGAALERAGRLRARIERETRAVSRADEIRYRQALAAEGLGPASAEEAISVFRNAELFYHWPSYRNAARVIQRWLDLLSLELPVGLLDGFGMHAKGEVNLCSTAELSDESVIKAVSSVFDGYLNDEFRACLLERQWDLVGLSVNYTSQLPVALRMAAMVRRCVPGAVIVFGGTEVGDMVKFTSDRDSLWRVFGAADLIVPGEGESALIEILSAIRDGTGFAGIRGVMLPGRPAYLINYENVAGLASPAFDVWDWDRYWSPEPVILYSPTRGCYWNKCTFCDYGLNSDKPTSPSRERPVPAVLDDLRQISRLGRVVYFAVDAMSPRYLRNLAAGLAASDLEINWGAELRLERTFPERAVGEVLSASGCIAISFGYESGSQRILDLIDKGVKIANVPGVLAELKRNGIAAQMMGFTGFPTETVAEARLTYEFLHRRGTLWALAGIGVFGLTSGSIVAKDPDRFGIELMPMPATDDIRRYVPWRDRGTGPGHWLPPASDGRIPRSIRRLVGRSEFDRPFVGGIDSAHSLLYFARHGPRLWPGPGPDEAPARCLVSEPVVTIPFGSLESLTSTDDLHDEIVLRAGAGARAHRTAIAEWLGRPGRAEAGRTSVMVLQNGVPIELPADIDMSADNVLSGAVRMMVAARLQGN